MYKFELENVLEVRKHIEDSLKSDLGAIEHMIKMEKSSIDASKRKKEKLAQNMQDKLNKGASSSEYLLFSGFINKINQDIETQYFNLMKTEEKRNSKRDELLTAVKNRKALETLKEKRAAEYKLKQEKIELHNLDDFSSIHHTRQMEAN